MEEPELIAAREMATKAVIECTNTDILNLVYKILVSKDI